MKKCVVCGRTPTWGYDDGTYVACDFHSQDEIADAVRQASTVSDPSDIVGEGSDESKSE